ncbi:plasmid partitioning protein RepB [Acidisoma cellulosilytica]|uniref:Plasmid partitioning protein RepB n=2 Tax=Acidisoma cellulosilyticum TaxID=2802395 RepID=A0A963Z6S7_9PROT|nr:plasmid partitioning protein RepB [Acidisoma cellulosilyticum]
MKRKDLLKAAFDKPVTDAVPPGSPLAETARVPSGAIRAMGLSLNRIEANAALAETFAEQIARGEVVQELDPLLIEPSFVDDRIDRTSDPDFRQLVESIAASGQQVPILVRPHKGKPGYYQVAYGHRRWTACRELQRNVKALVRPLSDADLVIAQGKENAERRNLSFIERATFAAHLESQGFERSVIQSALAVHPAEMTRLLAIAREIPKSFIAAIGPAPRAGRPRWMELAALLADARARERLVAIIEEPAFRKVGSDTRFDLALTRLRATKAPADAPFTFRDAQGRAVGTAEPTAAGFRLLFDLKLAPGLDRYLLENLPALIAAYESP